MPRDDDRLLDRSVAGDPDAFVAFYRLHRGPSASLWAAIPLSRLTAEPLSPL